MNYDTNNIELNLNTYRSFIKYVSNKHHDTKR